MTRERITELLVASESGSAQALDRVFPLVYEELSRVARALLRRERSGHTLDTAALVHEAYLKLVDLDRVQWRGRGHFLAIAAQAMRRVLVSHARARRRIKRGGDRRPVTLGDDIPARADRADEVLAIDAALDRLAEFDPRSAQVVECRFFGGLSVEETATALDIGTATVKRDWALAKAWLARELLDDGG